MGTTVYDDLGQRVVLGLPRHLVGAAPVAEDHPDDEDEDEPAHDQAGDEEALPEMEGGLALGGRSLVESEAGELAAGEEEGTQGDDDRGQAAWTLVPGTWGFGRIESGAGQRRVHGADTIEPGKKTGIGSTAACLAASVRVWRLRRLVGGPSEHSPRHGGGGAGGAGGEDLLAGALDTHVARVGQPGMLGQVAGEAQRPLGRRRNLSRVRPTPPPAARGRGRPGPPVRRPARPARPTGRARRPASAWRGCRPTTRRTGATPCAR